MPSLTTFLSILSTASLASAWIPSTVQAAAKNGIKGFNYGAGDDFITKFDTASKLAGGSKEYVSARLYQMSSKTGKTYTEAIDVAKDVDGMTLLLGLWCSGNQNTDPDGTKTFATELAALDAMLTEWVGPPGSVDKTKVADLKSKVVGISVGSEDVYRKQQWDSGNKDPGWGNSITNLLSFNEQVRGILHNYTLRGVIPIGHTDTNSAWTDATGGTKLASDLDFLALNTFPYWENAPVGDAGAHFDSALKVINGVAQKSGKPPVYIAETGWPITGPTRGDPPTDSVGNKMSNSSGITDNNSNAKGAVPSTEYAQQYFTAIGCNKLFGKYNTWWYTLYEKPYDATSNPKPQFAVAKGDANPDTQYDISCGTVPGSTKAKKAKRQPMRVKKSQKNQRRT